MYNRYVPNPQSGNPAPGTVFRPVSQPSDAPKLAAVPKKSPQPRTDAAFPQALRPLNLDGGDLLVLMVLLLILLEGEEDSLGILLALGVFLLF